MGGNGTGDSYTSGSNVCIGDLPNLVIALPLAPLIRQGLEKTAEGREKAGRGTLGRVWAGQTVVDGKGSGRLLAAQFCSDWASSRIEPSGLLQPYQREGDEPSLPHGSEATGLIAHLIAALLYQLLSFSPFCMIDIFRKQVVMHLNNSYQLNVKHDCLNDIIWVFPVWGKKEIVYISCAYLSDLDSRL